MLHSSITIRCIAWLLAVALATPSLYGFGTCDHAAATADTGGTAVEACCCCCCDDTCAAVPTDGDKQDSPEDDCPCDCDGACNCLTGKPVFVRTMVSSVLVVATSCDVAEEHGPRPATARGTDLLRPPRA
ncbi:MAG: hypothetical protein AAFX05_12445 [Planctomycetota bacterium]